MNTCGCGYPSFFRRPSPVPNGYSGTGTMPGGYPCLTGTYHGYPGVPIPVLHLIQDYRHLNDVTIKNSYPLPLISDMINKLSKAKFYTKLDVR